MIAWDDNLVSDIARRRCVLVLGAGISKNSTNAAGIRPKDWNEFLSAGVERVASNKNRIKRLIASGDYLTACELIKKQLGQANFNDFVRTEFLTPRFNAGDIHADIFLLDSRIVITPNFDNIYDGYARTETGETISIKSYYDNDVAEVIRRGDRLILKMHGTISAPNNLIFSRNDYVKARIEHAHFYKILEALAITHTFIFLGAGLNDPDIRLLLEDYAFRFEYSREHYFILPKTALTNEEKEIVEEGMNIKIVTYSPRDGHKELKESLKTLTQLVSDRRSDLSRTQDW